MVVSVTILNYIVGKDLKGYGGISLDHLLSFLKP